MMYVRAYLEAVRKLLPSYYWEIKREFEDETSYAPKSFALGCMKRALDEGKLSERSFWMLVRLMNNFSDRYERNMLESSDGKRTWFDLVHELLSEDEELERREASELKDFICIKCGDPFRVPRLLVEEMEEPVEELSVCDQCLPSAFAETFLEVIETVKKEVGK